ncbi:hypothetical protein PWT90_05688 [Aphanocladium album]|nr:hypothetical protein PWT90_05688 [Aphanocladium album]
MKFSSFFGLALGAFAVSADYIEDVTASKDQMQIVKAIFANPPVVPYKSDFVDGVLKHAIKQSAGEAAGLAAKLPGLTLEGITPKVLRKARQNHTTLSDAGDVAQRMVRHLANATEAIKAKPEDEKNQAAAEQTAGEQRRANSSALSSIIILPFLIVFIVIAIVGSGALLIVVLVGAVVLFVPIVIFSGALTTLGALLDLTPVEIVAHLSKQYTWLSHSYADLHLGYW